MDQSPIVSAHPSWDTSSWALENTRDGMSSQQWPIPNPDLVFQLALRVRRVSERAGWEWRLVDEREGSVFEKALPYESPEDARTAGLARLAELTPSLPSAKVSARTALTGHVIIVSRNERILHGILTRVFGDSEGIDIIEDRRWHWVDRKGPDRRAPLVEVEAQGPGWWMVRRAPIFVRLNMRHGDGAAV
jgi:hypothetical protein